MKQILVLSLLLPHLLAFAEARLVQVDTFCDSQFCYRPLLQNLDGKVIERMSAVCALMKQQGKPGTLLGKDCTPKAMYGVLLSVSDELGVSSVFGVHARSNGAMFGVVSFDRLGKYPVIKQNLAVPLTMTNQVFSSLIALFKRYPTIPYAFLNPDQTPPQADGVAFNGGFFKRFYRVNTHYRTFFNADTKNTEFESCDFDGWIYPCVFNDSLETIDAEEEQRLFKSHDMLLYLIVALDEDTKTLGYYTASDEFVELVKLDSKSTESAAPISKVVSEQAQRGSIRLQNITVRDL